MKDVSHINLNNARLEEQRRVMERIKKDGVCPFCPEHLAEYHTKPTLSETPGWIATENQWPYKGAQHHLLLISKRHISHPQQLTDTEWEEMHRLIQELTERYEIRGGSFLMRFGDTNTTGATVDHLHAHIIAADTAHPDYEPVVTRVG